MKASLHIFAATLLVAGLSSDAHGQAFPNDNDGLLDVGEAPGFPADPSDATGELRLWSKGIQDLDGTKLLTKVQRLDLSRNNITSIEPGDFDGLLNLQWLVLARNNIDAVDPGDFEELANLEILDLSDNSIASIDPDDFDGLTKLQSLNLRDNEIISIRRGDLDELTTLRTLYLSYNQISSIESGAFTELRALENLVLNNNDLTALDFTGAAFENINPSVGGHLAFGLNIYSNNITSLVLDCATLSNSSFDAVFDAIGWQTAVSDVSFVGATFTDTFPSDLSALLDIPTLDNVRVGPSFFNLYAAELKAFEALPGNTVTVVPEPSTLICMCIGVFASCCVQSRSFGQYG